MNISIIAAIGNNRELGSHGKIPWHLKSDMLHFRDLTTGHPVIMGRKTYESIGHPLSNRTNIVVSNNPEFTAADCLIANSLPHALLLLPNVHIEAFVIGGAEIYALTIRVAIKMYLTVVNYSGPANVHFPEFDYHNWTITHIETPPKTVNDDYEFEFLTYERIKPLTPQIFIDNIHTWLST